MLVEIKPLPVTKWHGKKGKDSFAQPKTVEVLYDSNTGAYATGLTTEEQDKYGKLIGVDLSETFLPDTPHPFYGSKASWVNLPNQTLVFDTIRNLDYVKVANCKASKYVANSMKEYEDGLWPEATHVIFSEEEEMELKASKFQLVQAASVKLVDKTLDGKIAIVQILSNKNVKGRSANFVDGILSELVQEKPEEVIRVLSMDKEEVVTRATVLELLQKNILTTQGQAVFYMGNQIGLDYEDAIKYFKDPNNAAMKVRLLEKIQK
jgi:hypothetical protein